MRLGFIGDILRFILDQVSVLVPKYGIAIILFTIIIRVLLMPLDVKSKRSMARMAVFQPQVDQLNKKYANDKEKLNQKIQELYKKEKYNPLSGCLPMLLSLPILFSMFAVMREVANERTVHMVLDIRKQVVEVGNTEYNPAYDDFLWIKNVFQPDSFMATVIPPPVEPLKEVPPEGEEDPEAWLLKKREDWLRTHALTGIGPSGNETNGGITQTDIDAARAFLATEEYDEWASSRIGRTVYSGTLLMWPIKIPEHFNGLLILPLLAGLTQILASKLTPGMQQPASSKNDANKSTGAMMKVIFPIMSVFICFTSNAGFALYWVAVNIIQVVQQYGIGKWIAYSDGRKLASKEAMEP